MKLPFAPVTATKPQELDSINDAIETSANIVPMPQKTTAVARVSPEVQAELDNLRGLNRLTINTVGHGTANEVANIADEVCEKQTVSKMGDVGKSITSILVLTESVNPDDFNFDKSKGLLGKAVGFFKKSKTEIESHYKSVSSQIEKMADKLNEECEGAARDNEFLERQFHAVVQQYQLFGYKIEALVLKEQEEQAKADAMAAANPTDPLAIQQLQDQNDFVTKINKQADRLRRTQHIIMLQMGTIRSTQSGNLDAIDDLTTLREETLPLWKSLIATAAMGDALEKRHEISNAVKDHTNAMAVRLAQMTGKNMVESAKMSQRSSFDIETLKQCQKTIITSSREAKKAIEAGAKERAAAIPLIAGMRDELRKEFAPKK